MTRPKRWLASLAADRYSLHYLFHLLLLTVLWSNFYWLSIECDPIEKILNEHPVYYKINHRKLRDPAGTVIYKRRVDDTQKKTKFFWASPGALEVYLYLNIYIICALNACVFRSGDIYALLILQYSLGPYGTYIVSLSAVNTRIRRNTILYTCV